MNVAERAVMTMRRSAMVTMSSIRVKPASPRGESKIGVSRVAGGTSRSFDRKPLLLKYEREIRPRRAPLRVISRPITDDDSSMSPAGTPALRLVA
jgi:hypothetical protein